MTRIPLVKDWGYIPYLAFASAAILVSIMDFVLLQDLQFQTGIFFLSGIPLLMLALYIRVRARIEVRRAGFESLLSTGRLQIVREHKLVKDGLYKHIRHPLYLGEMMRNVAFPLIFSSLIGSIFAVISIVVLLFRIKVEEKMLGDHFGEEYEEYSRKTKKLIPYVY